MKNLFTFSEVCGFLSRNPDVYAVVLRDNEDGTYSPLITFYDRVLAGRLFRIMDSRLCDHITVISRGSIDYD